MPGSYTVEQTAVFAQLLEGYCDIFHISNGHNNLHYSSRSRGGSMYDPHNCNLEQRDMCYGVQIFKRFSISDPKPLLPGGLKSGVVALTFGTQSVTRFEAGGTSVNGESVIVRNSDVFGAAGSLSAFFEALVVAGTVVQVAGTLERTGKLLAGASFIRKFAVTVHSQTSIAYGVSGRQQLGIFGVSLVKRDEAFASVNISDGSLREIYGADISQGMISKITDKILPEVNEWQNHPLESIYPIIYFAGIVFKSRKDSQITNKCVYSVLGIDMEGQKEILGIWISENESASFYASICSDLRKRGVSDVFIACHDNLKGLGGAINAVFPRTKQQLCIVHQVRNSAKLVPYKDREEVCADLKKIYGAVNLDDAEYAREEFREKWDKKYPSILRSWDANWTELTTFFVYPEQIRRLIYTTNAVEACHRMVRKSTQTIRSARWSI